MSFRQYVEHGWKLCPIRDGEKRPRGEYWNSPTRALTPETAEHTTAAGLMHAYSGTCALDIDNEELARAWLAERGVDLDALLQAPDSVHISSGTMNRGKLLYSMPVPLPSKKIVSDQKVTLFELRCGTADGKKTVQDLLPPSPHPSGRAYEWRYGDEMTGTWQSLPPVPPALLTLWRELVGPRTVEPKAPVAEPTAADEAQLLEQARALAAQLDPDCDYDTWLRFGMALENDLGDIGWQLWNEWSAKGKKYPGDGQLQVHWNSFGRYTGPPVTLGSFARGQRSAVTDFDDVGADDFVDPFEEERKAKVSKLKLWTLDEIQQQPWPTWHVQDVLPRAEINMLYGESGVGKSFIALDMTLAIAQGKPWFGHETNQTDVLWLAAEAFGSMKPRSKAYAMANDLSMEQLGAVPFRVLESFNLNNDELVSMLIEAIKDKPPGIVVVDTLAAASGGANENSGEDMGKILDNCRRIHYKTRASILLIHHSGKNADLGARGWSGIKAAVQGEFKVYFDEATSQRVFKDTKQRDGAPAEGQGFTLTSVTVGVDDKGRDISSAYVTHNGPVVEQEPTKGDGGGRAPPRTAEQRMALSLAYEVIGVAPDAASVDLAAAIVDALSPPPEGERDRRSQRARTLIDNLVAAEYLTQSGGRVKLVAPPEMPPAQVMTPTAAELFPEDDEDGSDLI